MYRHIDDDIPDSYPLALNGLGWTWNDFNPIQAYRDLFPEKVNYLADRAQTPTPTPTVDQSESGAPRPFSMPSQSTPSRTSLMNKPASVGSTSAMFKKIGDLFSFGAISDSDRDNLSKLVNINPAVAQRSIQAAEDRFYAKGPLASKQSKSTGVLDQIDGRLPEGYKLNQKLIPNVPNFALYGIVGVFTIFTLRSMTRK